MRKARQPKARRGHLRLLRRRELVKLVLRLWLRLLRDLRLLLLLAKVLRLRRQWLLVLRSAERRRSRRVVGRAVLSKAVGGSVALRCIGLRRKSGGHWRLPKGAAAAAPAAVRQHRSAIHARC
jgi:hypothetical protein